MGVVAQHEIDALLDDAQERRSLLAPQSERLAQRLRRRVDKGDAVHPYRGLYARADYWSSLKPDEQARHAMRGYRSLRPEWTFCDVSAAAAYGLYVSWHRLHELNVMIPLGSYRRSTPGIKWRNVMTSQSHDVDGMRVTSLDRATVDCMRHLPFCEGLGIADSWLRITGKSREDLIALVDSVGLGCKGVATARSAALYADGGSENGGESYARATMIELGYAIPQLQVEITDPIDTSQMRRVDYYWDLPDGTAIIGELDGLVKYTDPDMMGGLDSEQVRARERLRESRLGTPGTSVVRFSLVDVRDKARFSKILDRYGVPKCSRPLSRVAHRPRFKHVRCGGIDVRTHRSDHR